MQPPANQWGEIFKSTGHVLPEPSPLVIRFANQLRERGAQTVLDLGCGSGRHIVQLKQNGFPTVGMDYAPTGLKLTHEWLQKEHLKADLIQGDMRQSLPFRNNSFDAIISTQVIHHGLLTTVIAIASEFQRVLCQSGTILITVPAHKETALDGQDYQETELNTYVPTSGSEKGLPHHLFTMDELRAIFPQCEVQDLQMIEDRVIALNAIKI